MTVSCFRVLRELLFRLKLYLFGIRFYEQATHSDAPVVYSAEYRLDASHRINFKFFHVTCRDILMTRGSVTHEDYSSYAVQATMDATFPEDLMVYSGRSFFFNGRTNRFKKDEKQTLDLILDVYLDFLKNSMGSVVVEKL